MSAEINKLNPEPVWNYFYELTRIPRPTGHTEAVAAYVESFGKALGLETLRDEAGNVLVRKPATTGMEDCKTVILQSHLDMVPQKNSSVHHDFLTDPVHPYIDGDWVTAQDTTLGADNGIGVALAMAVLSGESLVHGPVEALFTIDEEVGMTGAFGLKPGFLNGRVLINCDSEEEGELFVGCAGGADLNISFRFKDDLYVPEGDIAVKLSLTGLKGGHSGVDIHLGRANANKLLFRFLKEAVAGYGARLSSIEGGSLRNAIPREAFAVITIPVSNADLFWEMVSDYQDLFRAEFAGIETDIHFTAEKVELPSTLIPEEIQDDLVNAVEGCQNGVISMLQDFPGTVESSSNLAVVTSSPGLIEIKILVRSSSESRKEWLCSGLESVFSLAGAKVEHGGSYNGWQPNIESPILKLMLGVYEGLYGKRPSVKVMHAGLECGIIQGIFPDMDMISIGPDLKFPHSPDEKVNITSVGKVWNYLKMSLEQINNL
ncbi:aminoacyl-histidine dipeptidase [Bacteroidia bacterium]|nr:aminoacyl-histidine dipeptidase [Bacteroidia bacterium]